MGVPIITHTHNLLSCCYCPRGVLRQPRLPMDGTQSGSPVWGEALVQKLGDLDLCPVSDTELVSYLTEIPFHL